MKVLEVENLTKTYPAFSLGPLSFSLEEGVITGFIGRNGAGKTTTIKSLLNLISSDGKIKFFGNDLKTSEEEIKQNIGYAVGGTSYYVRKKIKDVIAVTKTFYPEWNDELCESYLKEFSLDKEKRIRELSEGMKVKFSLTLALSHGAKLLILDEPTSGLDPVSREELTEIFLSLAKRGVTILFSTHVTEDLDACANRIIYIKKGKIIANSTYQEFVDSYRLVRLKDTDDKSRFIGVCSDKDGATGLIKAEEEKDFCDREVLRPGVRDIMIHLEKEKIYD